MTNEPNTGGAPGCVVCAVRALTEGTPKIWTPNTPGQRVSGVVLAVGTVPSPFQTTAPLPFVDLLVGPRRWSMDGVPVAERVRVVCYGTSLAAKVTDAAPVIGDILTVTFEGTRTIPPRGRWLDGRQYRAFSVEVHRGHH
jgi:hypothetical protein